MARKIADTKKMFQKHLEECLNLGYDKDEAKKEAQKMAYREWVNLRKSFIGGSDSAICVNMNPYGSLLTLYANKKGLSKEKESSEAMRLGTDLEQYVAERFMEKTGKKVINDNGVYVDNDCDYLMANIDRKVVGENAILECKTMGSFNGYNLESGEIPSHYYCQVQHYMMVMDADMAYLAVLVLQRGLYVIEVKRNDDFIKSLREAEIAFWTQYVEKGIMPEPDGSDASIDTLKELYPKGYKDTEIVIPGLDRLITDYKSLKEIADDYSKQAERVKAQICQRLGSNEAGIGLQYGCSWRNQSKETIDTKRLKAEHPEIYSKYAKVSEYRVFRTRTIKEKKK